MPIRQGFYQGGTTQRGLEGLFSGLSDVGQMMIERQDRQRQQDLELQRQEEEKNITGLESGTTTAEEVAARMQAMFPHAAKTFTVQRYAPFEQSMANKVGTIVGDIGKAHTPGEMPTEASVDALARARNVMPMSNVPPQFGATGDFDPTITNAYFDQLQRLDQAEKPIGEVAGQQGEGASAQPTKAPVLPHPFQTEMGLPPTTTGPPMVAGPTAGQAGGAKGAEAVAAAPGETEAALTKLMGSELSPQATAARTKQAADEAKARLGVEYSPEMLTLKTSLAAREEGARLDARAAHVKYEQGRRESDLGLPYLDLEQFQGDDKKFAAEAAVNHKLPVVGAAEKQLVEADDRALQQLQIVGELIPLLPKNILALPVVEWERAIQSDPRLAAFTALAPAALGMARTMAGTTGFRSNKMEMERAIAAYLAPSTAETKAVQLSTIYKMLVGGEATSLLPLAAERAAFVKAQTAPAAYPLEKGERAYRIHHSTVIYNADGSLKVVLTPKE